MPPNRDPRNPDNTCAAAVTPLINQYPAPLNQLVAIWQVRLLFLCICFPRLEFHSIDAKREVPVVPRSYRLRYVTLKYGISAPNPGTHTALNSKCRVNDVLSVYPR